MTESTWIAMITVLGGGALTILGAWVKSVSERAAQISKDADHLRDELREDIEACRREIRVLRDENQVIREERDRLRARVRELEHEVADLKAQVQRRRDPNSRTRRDDQEEP